MVKLNGRISYQKRDGIIYAFGVGEKMREVGTWLIFVKREVVCQKYILQTQVYS